MANRGVDTSIHGKRLFLDKEWNLHAKGVKVGLVDGPKIVLPGPSTTAIFDDFLGDVVADEWNYVEGTDTPTADGAIVEDVNGVFRLTGGDSAGTYAADGSALTQALNWKASQGNLKVMARFKLSSIAAVRFFFGFTDQKAIEGPIYSAGSANTLTSDASDAVGVMFDTAMTDDNFWLVGVKANTDATAQNTLVAPVAGTYETWEVELDTSGNAKFYRNGRSIGTVMSNAVTAATALTPFIGLAPQTATAGKTCDVDYINVSANRV